VTQFIRIPVFQANQQVVTQNGRFTPSALRSLNDAVATLGQAINEIASIPEIQAALATLDAAIAAAQSAADSANSAAAATKAETNLTNSSVSGLTLTATDAGTDVTINISAHTRIYGDGTSVSVSAGSVSGVAYDTYYYIYYDQASRVGGAVTYEVTTDPTVAAQVGDRHVVGGVQTPALGEANNDGDPLLPPGSGGIHKSIPSIPA
jgi:hypothetical protein